MDDFDKIMDFNKMIEDLNGLIQARVDEMEYKSYEVLAYFIMTYVKAVEMNGYDEAVLDKVCQKMKVKFRELRAARISENE